MFSVSFKKYLLDLTLKIEIDALNGANRSSARLRAHLEISKTLLRPQSKRVKLIILVLTYSLFLASKC